MTNDEHKDLIKSNYRLSLLKLTNPIMVVPQPALFIDDDNEKTLVVSDVHVGFEASMALRGVRLDSRDSAREMAKEITTLAKNNNATNIILLGDTKAGTSRIQGAEWDAVPEFLEQLCTYAKTTLVPGNHDAGITNLVPTNVNISASFGIILSDTLLTHGHVMPSENLAAVSRIIMGHVHPTLRDDSSVISGQRVWVSMRINKDAIFPSARGELELTVMPSYNKYIVSRSNRTLRKSISPILTRARDAIISAKIVTLDGVIIGDESLIDSVI